MKFEAIIPNIEGIVSLARNRLHLTKSNILGTAHGNGISLGDVLFIYRCRILGVEKKVKNTQKNSALIAIKL